MISRFYMLLRCLCHIHRFRIRFAALCDKMYFIYAQWMFFCRYTFLYYHDWQSTRLLWYSQYMLLVERNQVIHELHAIERAIFQLYLRRQLSNFSSFWTILSLLCSTINVFVPIFFFHSWRYLFNIFWYAAKVNF